MLPISHSSVHEQLTLSLKLQISIVSEPIPEQRRLFRPLHASTRLISHQPRYCFKAFLVLNARSPFDSMHSLGFSCHPRPHSAGSPSSVALRVDHSEPFQQRGISRTAPYVRTIRSYLEEERFGVIRRLTSLYTTEPRLGFDIYVGRLANNVDIAHKARACLQ